MSFSSSYLPLDGVEFKISDVINPPSLPTLPQEFKMNDISKLLSDSTFDFSLETSVLAKISSVREAEKKMAEKEEKRRMLSMKRRADAEKRRMEEMMSQQREVLQKKREEFLEQKRKKQQEKGKDDNSPESTSPTTDVTSTSTVSPTYENVEVPPKIPARNPFSRVQDGILTPQPVFEKTSESSTKANQSQPVVSGQNQIWEDFEDKELDPFTNVELKTIDDLAELQTVLQNARIGQGLNVTSHTPMMRPDQSQNGNTGQVDSHTPSPSSEDSSEETQITAPLYENISLQEVNEIATKLERQNKDSSIDIPKNNENTPSFSSNSTKTDPPKEQNSEPTLPISPEAVYSKVQKKQPDHTTSSNNQPKLVQTSLNPNNPFLSTSEFGATSQLHSNFHNPTQPTVGYLPSLTETQVNQSALYANLFNPVSTGLLPSNIVVCTNSNSGSSSPVFTRATTSQFGVSNPTSNHVNNSVNSKVLPVSFGPASNAVATPNLQGTSRSNKVNNQQTKNISQKARVAPKPPIPAPRKPAILPRQSANPSSTVPNGAQTSTTVQNGPTKGQAHLLPPYAIPTSEAKSTAPSTESGFINKSKQDRAKFAETVNKALSSLPQNPVPVQKKTQNTANHELQPPSTVTRTLSLKSSLIAGLTTEEQTFVKNMISMGFDGEATVRAMQHFGLDDKEVVDHLIQVQGIMEQGYASTTVQDALEMYPKDGNSVDVYLTKFQQLADMGFPKDKVRDALKSHNNDQAKALDQLMEAT